MKKLLASLLCVALCLTLSGCLVIEDTPSKVQGGAETSVKNSAQAKEDIYSLNESAVFDDLKFTATEIKQTNGTDFFTPEKGNVFVGVKFTVENISDEEQSVSSLLSFEGYVDDVKCDYSLSAACAFDEGTLDGSIAPGKKLVGWYALEVPNNWEEVEIDINANLFSSSPAKYVFKKGE
ncbi:MAG: DUF5067 domain-containing protein [Clostridia bacterium]|nr:DUF5067 domain-containing protein [Clostridia bacterium]